MWCYSWIRYIGMWYYTTNEQQGNTMMGGSNAPVAHCGNYHCQQHAASTPPSHWLNCIEKKMFINFCQFFTRPLGLTVYICQNTSALPWPHVICRIYECPLTLFLLFKSKKSCDFKSINKCTYIIIGLLPISLFIEWNHLKNKVQSQPNQASTRK